MTLTELKTDLAEYKGHLSVLCAKIVAVITVLDLLNWVEKLVAIVFAIVMGIWGMRHLRSRVELNKAKKREQDLKNEELAQIIYERRKKFIDNE